MTRIKYIIDDAQWDDFKAGILKIMPVPLDIDEQPIMTENKWIKSIGLRYYMTLYHEGKRKIAKEATIPTIISTIIGEEE